MTHPGYPMPPLHLALCLCDLPMLYSEPYRFAVPMPCLYSAKLSRTAACLCTSGLGHAVALPASQCATVSCRCVTNLSMHCHVLPLHYRHLITSPCHNTDLLRSPSPCRCVSGLTWLNFTVAHHSSVQSSYLCQGCSLQQITQPYRRSTMPTSVIPCRHNTLLILAMLCLRPAVQKCAVLSLRYALRTFGELCRCPAHLNHALLCRGYAVLSIAVLRHCTSAPIFNELRRSTRYAIRTERLTGQLSALVPQYPPYNRSERCLPRPS